MRKRRQLMTGLWVALALCLGASQAPAQKINLPPVRRVTESNGARILLMPYAKTPTLTLLALFPAGDAHDPAGKEGIATLVSTLMRRGTATRTAPQISEAIDFLGGSLNVGAGAETLQVSLNVLAKDTDAGLELFADIIRNSVFPEAELERERQLAIAGLQGIGEEPRNVAAQVTGKATYGTHPYGATATIASLGRIAREDVVGFYKRHIAPDHMILVAVGDFQAPDLEAKLRAKFGDWEKNGQALATLPKVSAGKAHNTLVDMPTATQTQVRLMRIALPLNHPDHYAAEIANTVLGGGFTSRLTDEIRVNRSLTYGIGSGFGEKLAGGDFEISTFTKIETTRDILKATQDVLKQTAERGFSEEEIRKVKGYLTGLFAIRAQTPQALAAQIANVERNGLPKDYLQTYLQKIQAVSLSDANRIAKTYFRPDALSILLVAPLAKVKDQIKPFGSFEIIPVDRVGKE